VIDEAKAAQARAADLQSGSTTHVKEYGEKGMDYLTEMEKQIDADIQVELLRKQKYEAAGLEYRPVDNVGTVDNIIGEENEN
jgi:hypothetical protein